MRLRRMKLLGKRPLAHPGHSGLRRNPGARSSQGRTAQRSLRLWVPAFAGMTHGTRYASFALSLKTKNKTRLTWLEQTLTLGPSPTGRGTEGEGQTGNQETPRGSWELLTGVKDYTNLSLLITVTKQWRHKLRTIADGERALLFCNSHRNSGCEPSRWVPCLYRATNIL